jgi:hypothetical protein
MGLREAAVPRARQVEAGRLVEDAIGDERGE